MAGCQPSFVARHGALWAVAAAPKKANRCIDALGASSPQRETHAGAMFAAAVNIMMDVWVSVRMAAGKPTMLEKWRREK